MADLRRITKNGHSWQITLPKALLRRLGLVPGVGVIVEQVNGHLEIAKAARVTESPLSDPGGKPRGKTQR